MSRKVFISFNYKDREFAKNVKTFFNSQGGKCQGEPVYVEKDVSGNGNEAIDDEIKNERHSLLMRLQQDISEDIQANKIRKILEVVIEEITDDPLVYVGRTAYDAPDVDGVCYVHRTREQKTLHVGDFVQVKIDDAMEFDVLGVLI